MSYNIFGDIMRHYFLKLVSVICVFLLLLSVSAEATGYFYDGSYHEYTAEPIWLSVNGQLIQCDMPPILLNNRTMVPAVFVFTALGAEVTWLSRTRQVEISYGEQQILLTIDSRDVLLNNRTVSMNANDPPAKIINDRTMIPARFVAENLGMQVGWDNATRTVSLIAPSATKVTERPTAKPTAAPTHVPPSGSVSSVTYNNRTITVKGTNLGKVSVSKLTDPLRYIFDINDTAFSGGDKNLSFTNDCIAAIRYANHPTYARLVVDANSGTTYTYSAGKTSLVINLQSNDPSSTTPTAKPTATTAPKPAQTAKPTTVSTAAPTTAPRKKNAKPIVVLDAGHGGTDPGAIGRNEDGKAVANEKDVNLAITLKVYNLLKADEIDTYLTRKDDTYITLGGRTTYANSLNADIFVSIHSNAVENTGVNGMMVMYNPNSTQSTEYFTYSTEMAQFVLNHLKKETDLKNLGLRDGSGLWVIRKTSMPAILVECAFITNESDREKLTDDQYQDKIARAIYLGIKDALAKNK